MVAYSNKEWLPDMSPKNAEYRLTPEAERDMESVWLYTLDAWGLEQANRYTDNLVSAFGKLADRPHRGQGIDHIRRGYRRNRVGRHMIYYRITDYGIAVIRVLHDRMLPSRHLPNVQ